MKIGARFEHKRLIIGSPKAGTARPDVCRITKLTRGTVYYRNESGMLLSSARADFPSVVGRWVDGYAWAKVEQGTGPLKMFGVYCDHPKCEGVNIGRYSHKADADKRARQHDAIHEDAWIAGCRAVLDAVLEERRRQVARYGLNEALCDGTGPETRWLIPFTGASAHDIEVALRADYEDFEDEAGLPTWVHLIREEIAEAFKENDPAKLSAELIQVAALCVSWVEQITQRGAKPCEEES